MTDEQIVRTLAEKVMGWPVCAAMRGSESHRLFLQAPPPRLEVMPTGNALLWHAPNFPADEWNPLERIQDAFMVVEKMWGLGFWMRLECGGGVIDSCRFSTSAWKGPLQVGNNAPRAICLAAIAATEEQGK